MIDANHAEAEAPSEPAFTGYVDGLSHQWRVIGWVRPSLAGVERLQVQLSENGALLDSAAASMFRGDLLGAGIGDGQYGFSLKIPPALFDGSRHTLLVRAAGVPGESLVGKLDVALPNRAPPRAAGAAPRTATELLHGVLKNRTPVEVYDLGSEVPALTSVLETIARTYDQATALGLLYVHVLGRRIDADGLRTRLTRLSNSNAEMATIVAELLASEEAQTLYKSASAGRFPDSAALDVWTRLRRFSQAAP